MTKPLKKNFRNRCAMTLTELLIASLLVGVVIIGALSADYSVRTWHKRIEERTMVQQDLMITMERILKDADKAVGSGVCNGLSSDAANPCYYDNAVANDIALVYRFNAASGSTFNLLCFREDPDLEVSGDEQKVCYELSENAATTGPVTDYTLSRTVTDKSSSTTENNLFTTSQPYFGHINYASNGNVASIELNLSQTPNPDQAEDPLKNQKFTLDTSFFPKGISQ